MERGAWNEDPVVQGFREQISAADRTILEALNRRIELVGRLRDYKAQHGYPFLDRVREASLLEELEHRNEGPLSAEGLREFFSRLLALVKHEVDGASPSERGGAPTRPS